MEADVSDGAVWQWVEADPECEASETVPLDGQVPEWLVHFKFICMNQGS